MGLDALRLENLPLTIDQMLGGDTLPLQLLDLTYVPAATHTVRLAAHGGNGWLYVGEVEGVSSSGGC